MQRVAFCEVSRTEKLLLQLFPIFTIFRCFLFEPCPNPGHAGRTGKRQRRQRKNRQRKNHRAAAAEQRRNHPRSENCRNGGVCAKGHLIPAEGGGIFFQPFHHRPGLHTLKLKQRKVNEFIHQEAVVGKALFGQQQIQRQFRARRTSHLNEHRAHKGRKSRQDCSLVQSEKRACHVADKPCCQGWGCNIGQPVQKGRTNHAAQEFPAILSDPSLLFTHGRHLPPPEYADPSPAKAQRNGCRRSTFPGSRAKSS